MNEEIDELLRRINEVEEKLSRVDNVEEVLREVVEITIKTTEILLRILESKLGNLDEEEIEKLKEIADKIRIIS
jgi:alpha-L-fucosidase